MNRYTTQPIIQILAKPALLDQNVQILIRGSEDANIDFDSFASAKSLEPLFLKQPEYLRLDTRSHVTDLVEEKRTAVALLELANAAVIRPGERSFLVAE